MTDIHFGFELEVRSGSDQVLEHLREAGFTQHDHLHRYHCSCGDCGYSRDLASDRSLTFHAQEDCTVDGEFITGIMVFGSDEHYAAVDAITTAICETGASVEGDTGLHVHVSRADTVARSVIKNRRLTRLFAYHLDELYDLAAGFRSRVREYNTRGVGREHLSTRDTDPYYGSYLDNKANTWEFRIWNATRVAWRVNLAIGVSVAIARAAADPATGPVMANDEISLAERLMPYLSDETWAGLLVQNNYKGTLNV